MTLSVEKYSLAMSANESFANHHNGPVYFSSLARFIHRVISSRVHSLSASRTVGWLVSWFVGPTDQPNNQPVHCVQVTRVCTPSRRHTTNQPTLPTLIQSQSVAMHGRRIRSFWNERDFRVHSHSLLTSADVCPKQGLELTCSHGSIQIDSKASISSQV